MTLILGRARSVGAYALLGLGTALFVGFSVGCMSLNIGGKTEVASQDTPVAGEGLQRGKAFVPQGREVCVYYPVPYTSPPNLEIEDLSNRHNIQIVEQKPDYVRLRNTSGAAVDVSWKTRGLLVTTAKTLTTEGAVQPAAVSAQPR